MTYLSPAVRGFIFSFILAYGLLSHGNDMNDPLNQEAPAEQNSVIGYRIPRSQDQHPALYQEQQNLAEHRPEITIVVSPPMFNEIQAEQAENRGNGLGPIAIAALENFQNIFLQGQDISQAYSAFTFASAY